MRERHSDRQRDIDRYRKRQMSIETGRKKERERARETKRQTYTAEVRALPNAHTSAAKVKQPSDTRTIT